MNTETDNAELQEARRDLDYFHQMYIGGIAFKLPRGWSQSMFAIDLMTHRMGINGITPLEALPRAQTFIELIRNVNEVRS